MISLKKHLSLLLGSAFEAEGAGADAGRVLDSQRPDLSQFQCNGAMAASKAAKKNPRDLAQAVVARVENRTELLKISVEGPGFINLSVTDEFLAAHVAACSQDARFACAAIPAGKIVLDYGGPNVAKSMHVGHLRSAIIGECLKRLYRFLGAEVVSDVHLGDWGTQMGMLVVAVQEEGISAEELSMADLERLYPAMSARCKEDETLAEKARHATRDLQQGESGHRKLWERFVQLSKEALSRDFASMGVSFDLWYGESRYQDKIPSMLESMKAKSLLVLSEGAQVIELESKNGAQMPPLLLVKGDGGYLYGTTDMATLAERTQEMKAAKVVYVTDKRQSLHFQQVFQASEKMGWTENCTLVHAAFGTMNGEDGKPFKTRAGGVLRLKDLLEQAKQKALEKMTGAGIGKEYPVEELEDIAAKVGLAAVKFADLSNHRTTDYIFDLEKFTSFEGRTGPYLLYQAVRIKSILRKAKEAGLTTGKIANTGDAERPLLLALSRIAESLEDAAETNAPNLICDTAYDLASAYSAFYQKCHILNEKDAQLQGSWMSLSEACLSTLEKTLGILGMEIPQRM